MITSNSRYTNANLVMIQGSDGNRRTTVIPPEPKVTQFAYTTHVITGFDRLDTLASQYLSDPSAWWQICRINPERVDWTVLPVGETIRIPVV